MIAKDISTAISGCHEGRINFIRYLGNSIDANLEAQDEGKTAGIFIMFTVIGALLVVGLTLKSYWATAICGIGLGVLIYG
ncbi:MAG: hypothetical protein Ct9H300mP27_08300 [Chloroflexota bacterium]|nr:MAG: hypothetical protein Ct9H300mP27_08300 [Chloroflexota bacterium]